MAKSDQMRSEAVPVPVNSPKVRAAICPENPDHINTQVYSVRGKVRYCKCNTCGRTWKQIVGDDDKSDDFLINLADSLETSPTQKDNGVDVVMIPSTEVKKIVEKLRELSMNPA